MRNIIITDDCTIFLGKTGENLATQIQFPFVEKYRATFGEGTFQLLVKRATDEHPYAVPLTLSGDNVCWSVENTDVAIEGNGYAELQYFVEETLAKSVTWRTKVIKGLGEAGEAPEPWQSWIDDVLSAGSAAQESASEAKESELNAKESEENALASAESASESEESARISANNAQAHASSASASAQGASESAQNALEAMISAEASEQLASASASSASASAVLAGEAKNGAESAKSSAENSASIASSSAGQAQGYANSASGSANTASEKASQASASAASASSSASSASASASSASESASTASTKASEASASATSAQASATQASASADSASASATSAETAKDEVEAIAENIETLLASKVDKTEYDAKTAEIDEKDASQDELIASLEAENRQQAFQIADLKNIVYDTVVEDAEYTYDELDVAPIPTHVSDGTNYHKVFDGAETMLVEIQGKTAKSFNLWNEEWEQGSISATGADVASDTTIRSVGYIDVSTSSTYYCFCGTRAIGARYYDANKAYLGSENISNKTFAVPQNCRFMRFVVVNTTAYANDICVNFSQPDTSISPHNGDYKPHFDGLKSSVIEGVRINGANLIDAMAYEVKNALVNSTGQYASGSYEKSIVFPCKPNTEYSLFADALEGMTTIESRVRVGCFDEEPAFGTTATAFVANSGVGRRKVRIITTANSAYLVFFFANKPNITTAEVEKIRASICVNYGNLTAYPYRPYKPPFNFSLPSPQELRSAGTAHDPIRLVKQTDGTWNVEKVDGIGEVDLGTLVNYTYSPGGSGRFSARIANAKAPAATTEKANIICSTLSEGSATNVYQGTKEIALDTSSYVWVLATTLGTTNPSVAKEKLNGVILYYELATPTATTLMTGLTEQDIATLIELYGSVEIVGNTNKDYARPNLATIIQCEKAVES